MKLNIAAFNCALAAISTLEKLGYTYTDGAELWKPPLGPRPVFENEWIEWRGGQCPLPGDTKVEVRFRNLEEFSGLHARTWIWCHENDEGDIIAYRVVPHD